MNSFISSTLVLNVFKKIIAYYENDSICLNKQESAFSKNKVKLNSLYARFIITDVTLLNTFDPSTEVMFTFAMYLVRNFIRGE